MDLSWWLDRRMAATLRVTSRSGDAGWYTGWPLYTALAAASVHTCNVRGEPSSGGTGPHQAYCSVRFVSATSNHQRLPREDLRLYLGVSTVGCHRDRCGSPLLSGAPWFIDLPRIGLSSEGRVRAR
jgi:hypothetical protein